MTSWRQFQVSTRMSGRRRTVRVKVYDDLGQLRRDATSHDRRVGLDVQTGHFDEALAVAHTFETFRFDADGDERPGEAAGLIRYWSKRLGTSVVVHEVVHVASGIYRQDWQPEHGPVHDGIDNEEALCHLVGDLTRRVVDRLYKLGYYAPDNVMEGDR